MLKDDASYVHLFMNFAYIPPPPKKTSYYIILEKRREEYMRTITFVDEIHIQDFGNDVITIPNIDWMNNSLTSSILKKVFRFKYYKRKYIYIY